MSPEQLTRDATQAQPLWARKTLGARLAILKKVRHAIAEKSSEVLDGLGERPGRTRAESLNTEVLPLADSIQFLERDAAKLLAPQYLNSRGRPTWMMGHHAIIMREPLGVILVIGPSNFPLMLPGIQAIQALAAGNAVIIKPGITGLGAALSLQKLLIDCGLDPRLFGVLDESTDSARAAWTVTGLNGTPLVKKVIMTGAAHSGAAILGELAPKLIPATMELSGCDAAFVLPGADLELTARAIVWGLRLNAGCACIAPRRIFVWSSVSHALEKRLSTALKDAPALPVISATLKKLQPMLAAAIKQGATPLYPITIEPERAAMQPLVMLNAKPDMELTQADIFAPVCSIISVGDERDALEGYAACPYALGASVFGEMGSAMRFGMEVRAGSVAINDLIAPTVDPRIPFGGLDRSGFGSTRGSEGLLEMTYPKIITRRSGSFRPHYDPSKPEDEMIFSEYLRAEHGKHFTQRLRSWWKVLNALRKRK